jgi:hypothetical protein
MPSDGSPSKPFRFRPRQCGELGHVKKPHVILISMGRSRFIARSRPPTFAGQVLVFLIEVFWPVLQLFGFLFRIIWKVVFSWWANPLFDRWMRNSFASEVRGAMPFLFDQFAGRVVPDPQPKSNDPMRSYLTISTSNLFFKFSRWRSEDYEIKISPLFAPTDSYDFMDALEAAGFNRDSSLSPAAESWYHFGKVLEPRFHVLEQAFKQTNFQATKEKLSQLRMHSRWRA